MKVALVKSQSPFGSSHDLDSTKREAMVTPEGMRHNRLSARVTIWTIEDEEETEEND